MLEWLIVVGITKTYRLMSVSKPEAEFLKPHHRSPNRKGGLWVVLLLTLSLGELRGTEWSVGPT